MSPEGSNGAPILEVAGLVKRFGGVTAVDGLDLVVQPGEIRGLIGPNGAGKTTTFNTISGFYAPDGGTIRYRGEDLAGLSMHRIAAKGLVRTFQHATLFLELRVWENIEVGCHLEVRPNPFAAIFRRRVSGTRASDRVNELLAFFGLEAQRDSLASELPYGQQRALGMAVALAAGPEMLLLDEPFAGMNPEETRQMMELVSQLRERGLTVLLVEHDMQAVMGLCDQITVMDFGRLLAEGRPEEIQTNSKVVQAYLGSSHDAA